MTILHRLPLIFVVLAPIFWTGAFILGRAGHGSITSLVTYPAYALAITGIWLFLLGLLRRSQDGTGSVLLVCLFYETFFFAVTLWALAIIAPLLVFETDMPYLRHITRSFVVASAGASWVTVVIIYGAWRYDLLDAHIRPWPWSRKDRRVR